jgi:ribosomal protein L37AE/L43A
MHDDRRRQAADDMRRLQASSAQDGACPSCGGAEVGYPRSDTSQKHCRGCGHQWREAPERMQRRAGPVTDLIRRYQRAGYSVDEAVRAVVHLRSQRAKGLVWNGKDWVPAQGA